MEIRSLSKCLTEDGAGASSSFVAISLIKSVNAVVQNKTIWAPANQMAVLLDKRGSVIKKRINHVLDEGELSRANNTQNMRVVRIYGGPFL